jgi:aminoglycoside phosphotransferase family enzyme/gluconate kinase
MIRWNRKRGEPEGIPRLIASLLADPGCYDHAVLKPRLIETHISWVILTGEFAYKIKKPIDLGFLDFSKLALRKQDCEDEVRLNRRLAPDYYLGMVAVSGDAAHPHVDGIGPAFEYAVKMKQFDSTLTMDHLALQGKLAFAHIDAVAARLSRFHTEECAIARPGSRWGTPGQIVKPVLENFAVLEECLGQPEETALLAKLRSWTERELIRLMPLMRRRKRNGMVRECHGDLHLGNLAWTDNALLIFDCIEFNAALRWIDIISEVAFLFMDLLHRNLQGHAMRFLNAWLEASGDYEGVALLRYYTVYRALVRAKVAALRMKQTANTDESVAEVTTCLHLAAQLIQTMPTQLWITHGLSGSGKTTISQQMLQDYGMIRIRSDVERKRLHGYQALDRIHGDIGASLYSAGASTKTYTHLARLAGQLLKSGWPVVVDAAFLQRSRRKQFHELADKYACPFRIVDIRANIDSLRMRVGERARHGNDASDAGLVVLQQQIKTENPLDAKELQIAAVIQAN